MGNRLRLQMRLLLCLANLLLQTGSIVADSCTSSNTCRTCRECSGVSNQFYVLKNARVNLTCDGDPGNNPWFHITETSNISIRRGTSRYTGSGNWLEISIVFPEDEGRYECQVGDSVQTAGCVFVLGMGEFAQCPNHWHSQICGTEHISVPTGSTIVFDIRLMFINSGPCGLPQDTGYLHFTKGEVTARNNVYVCSIRDNRCPETFAHSPIRAVWGGGHRFNLNLTKAYATVNDQALYTVSLHLHYRGAPNITNKPDNPDIVIDSGVTQTIIVKYNPGNPVATVQWSKDGQLIDGLSNPLISAAPNSTILMLTNNNASIRGRYLVNVSNIAGSDTFEYNVKAVFGPNMNLTISPHNSSGVRLTCSARGYPRLDHVTWQTGNGNLVSGSVDEISLMESSTFDFNITSTLDLDLSHCDSNTYRCSVSSGSITRSTSISCEIAVDCGTLTNPVNGQVSHTAGTTFGQTANYSCNTGYNLVGNSTRTCQAAGVWAGSAPTCHTDNVDCGTLTNPVNGQVSHAAGTTFGQTANYSCNTGYNLVGNNTRTCQAAGVWSGSAPTCHIVDCGTLNDPPNGQAHHTAGTRFGQTATYSCDTGYNLVGGHNRTCQATGVWSGSAPTCEVTGGVGTSDNRLNTGHIIAICFGILGLLVTIAVGVSIPLVKYYIWNRFKKKQEPTVIITSGPCVVIGH